MDFTVVIVTCNRASSLGESLTALAEQEFELGRTQIVVADNGSTDETRAVAEAFRARFTNFDYLFDARPGQLVGWHRALAIAAGEITCFIDDDVRPDTGWLRALADAYRDPKVSLATGPIRLMYDAAPPDWLASMTLGETGAQTVPLLGGLDCGNAIRPLPGNFVWGSNFSIRRTLLLEIGGFHPCAMPWPLIRFYGDGEVHVGREAERRGHKILYHPGAAVDHHIPAARLTLEGVERKFTTTGCARSFQTLRNLGQAYPAPSADEIRAIARRYFRADATAPSELVAAVEIGLDRGMTMQRDAFLDDPRFHDWIMRESFLDLDACYTHPDLIPGEIAGGDWRSGT